MPWWSWLIISLLAFITLGFSGWYLLSVGQFCAKTNPIDWSQFLAFKQPLTSEDIARLKDKYLILLVVIGDVDVLNQHWQPLCLIKTDNIEKTVNNLKQKLKENEVDIQKDVVSDYLRQTKQSSETIKYYLFRHYHSEILLNRAFSKWLIKSNLKQIGFNQFDDVFR